MGKVSLLLVAAFGVAGATIFFTSKEADVKASSTQGTYQADVIAREIARSAYNAGVADVNRHGLNFDQAILDFGELVVSKAVPDDEKCANGKPICGRRTGEMLGGTYVTEASINGGNGVEIYTAGTFGFEAGHRTVSKTHRINEAHSHDVLRVDKCGKLKIDFVDSQAGYCSAIFLQRTVAGEVGLPEMVYAPGKNRNGERNRGFEVVLEPQTQMNFAIGVDNACRNGGTRPTSHPALRMGAANALLDSDGDGEPDSAGAAALSAEMASYVYRADDWAWTHWALDGSALRGSSLGDGEPKEAPWGMVEADPNNAQRWRIAFEDKHEWNLEPGHPDYNDPRKSLWATKRYGYDTTGDGKGDGWKDEKRITMVSNGPNYVVGYSSGKDGFHDLRDTGSPADFSDQVVFVEIVPDASACASAPLSGGGGGGAVPVDSTMVPADMPSGG